MLLSRLRRASDLVLPRTKFLMQLVLFSALVHLLLLAVFLISFHGSSTVRAVFSSKRQLPSGVELILLPLYKYAPTRGDKPGGKVTVATIGRRDTAAKGVVRRLRPKPPSAKQPVDGTSFGRSTKPAAMKPKPAEKMTTLASEPKPKTKSIAVVKKADATRKKGEDLQAKKPTESKKAAELARPPVKNPEKPKAKEPVEKPKLESNPKPQTEKNSGEIPKKEVPKIESKRVEKPPERVTEKVEPEKVEKHAEKVETAKLLESEKVVSGEVITKGVRGIAAVTRVPQTVDGLGEGGAESTPFDSSVPGVPYTDNEVGEQIFIGRDEYNRMVLQDEIVSEICLHWRPPPGAAEGTNCYVLVSLGTKGEFVAAEVTKRSGNAAFDVSARKAVSKLNYPRGVWGKRITIRFTK